LGIRNNLKSWGKQKIAQTGNRPAPVAYNMLTYEITVCHLLLSSLFPPSKFELHGASGGEQTLEPNLHFKISSLKLITKGLCIQIWNNKFQF